VEQVILRGAARDSTQHLPGGASLWTAGTGAKSGSSRSGLRERGDRLVFPTPGDERTPSIRLRVNPDSAQGTKTCLSPSPITDCRGKTRQPTFSRE